MKDKFPHYWLCSICAEERGGVWPEGHCATVMHGRCPYCESENVTIIPWIDFDWPQDNKVNIKAKMGRD